MGSQVLPFLMRTLEDFSCHSYVTIHLMLAEGVFCFFLPLSSITFPFGKSLQTLSLVLEVAKTKACPIQPFTQPLGLLSLYPATSTTSSTRDSEALLGPAERHVPSQRVLRYLHGVCHSADIAPLRPSELLYSLNSSHTPNFCLSNPKKKLCWYQLPPESHTQSPR